MVNAARVSFGKKSNWEWDGDEHILSKADTRLIQFLARGCTSGDWDELMLKGTYGNQEDFFEVVKHIKNMPTHWTPFGHTAITLHVKAPIFVARQLGKHQVGMVWNEVSRRYVTDEPEFYDPPVFRLSADNVKQGSSDIEASVNSEYVQWSYAHEQAVFAYEDMLKAGVCPEQARMVLPQSMYTEWYWTGNLYAFANVFIQRTDSHAQREVQMVAKQIGDIIEPLFPVAFKALTK